MDDSLTNNINQAAQLRAIGQLGKAKTLYEKVLQANPNHPAALVGLGIVIGRLGRPLEGIESARRAIVAEPNNGRFLVGLADLHHLAGQCEESLEYAKRAVEVDPTIESAHCLIANNLAQLQRIDEAILHLAEFIGQHRNATNARITHAHLLIQLGRFDEARIQLEAILGSPGLLMHSRCIAMHELSVALDKTQDYQAAFDLHQEQGRLRLTTPEAKQFNRFSRPALIAGYRKAADRQRFARLARNTFDPETEEHTPAFLVGFPRSGTTMTELMLAAHPGIVTTGERPFLASVRSEWARCVGGSNDFAGMFDRLTRDHLVHLRRHYWDQVRKSFDSGDWESGTLLVDKSPLNIIDLGLINAVFPDAKIVVALRDPRDVCISCLFRDFRLSHATIHLLTIEDIAEFYSLVMGLYLHLKSVLSLSLIENRYENTTRDPEGAARSMIRHLDLDWDARMLEFHKRPREDHVTAISRSAAGRLLDDRAVARWKNYEPRMQTVLPKLRRYIEAFGYAPD